jgi:predicted RND superfamily exporter protein
MKLVDIKSIILIIRIGIDNNIFFIAEILEISSQTKTIK